MKILNLHLTLRKFFINFARVRLGEALSDNGVDRRVKKSEFKPRRG